MLELGVDPHVASATAATMFGVPSGFKQLHGVKQMLEDWKMSVFLEKDLPAPPKGWVLEVFKNKKTDPKSTLLGGAGV